MQSKLHSLFLTALAIAFMLLSYAQFGGDIPWD